MNKSTHLSGCGLKQNDIQDCERLARSDRSRGDGKEGTLNFSLHGFLLECVLLGCLFLTGSCSFINTELQSDIDGQKNSPAETPSSAIEPNDRSSSSENLAAGTVTETAISANTSKSDHQGTEKNRVASAVGGGETVPGDRAVIPTEERIEFIVVNDNAIALTTIVNQLGPICNPLTNTTYESQHLRFPDSNTTVYGKGRLRKVMDPDSALRQSDTSDYCYPDQRVTPDHSLVIQREGSSILIDMEADPNGYVITTPVSFSADGQYLIAAVEVAYTGGDPGAYSIIFDLDRREKLAMESYICKDADFDEYLGFTQPSEVAFRCSYYGGPGAWTEVLDLETRSISKTSIAAESLEDYGTVVQPFQYAIDHRSDR